MFINVGDEMNLEYEGEIDENRKPCGVGEAGKYRGTWFNGERHGIGK